jgi:hypothetical protein
MSNDVERDEKNVPLYKSQDYSEFVAWREERDADYNAIGRAGALLLILQIRGQNCQKYQIMKAGMSGGFPLYSVRKVGLFGLSKDIPGFARGRIIEIEQQLRRACEEIVGPISDEEIDSLATEVDLWPISGDGLIKRIKAL